VSLVARCDHHHVECCNVMSRIVAMGGGIVVETPGVQYPKSSITLGLFY
jgi:hypothetical protein